jgi:hypothetical protein
MFIPFFLLLLWGCCHCHVHISGTLSEEERFSTDIGSAHAVWNRGILICLWLCFCDNSFSFFCCLFVCLFVLSVLEFELKALHLLGKCSTTWATPLVMAIPLKLVFLIWVYTEKVIPVLAGIVDWPIWCSFLTPFLLIYNYYRLYKVEHYVPVPLTARIGNGGQFLPVRHKWKSADVASLLGIPLSCL